MKSLLFLAAFISLLLHHICQAPVKCLEQYDDSLSHTIYVQQNIEKEPFSLYAVNPQFADHSVCGSSILQNHTFRNQLLQNFNTTMLKKLRDQQPVLAALNNM